MIFSKKILGLTVVVLLLVASYLLVTSEYFFQIEETTISVSDKGLSSSAKEKLIMDLEESLSPYRGKNIWTVSLQGITEVLKENKLIRKVRVSRELPKSIRVSVTLSEIVLVYVNKKRQLIPVTREGYLLNRVTIEHVPDVPVLRDHKLVKNPQQLKTLVQLYAELPRKGSISRQTITEIFWDKQRGLKVEVSGRSGVIIFGLKNIKLRLKRVTNVLKYLESQKQKWRVIDASFSKKVLVRLRKHS